MTESYVIHIYRRDPANPDRMIGTVERIGDQAGAPFHSIQELWALLAATPVAAPMRRGAGTPD
jgi:hypothetical protein